MCMYGTWHRFTIIAPEDAVIPNPGHSSILLTDIPIIYAYKEYIYCAR